MIRNLLLIDDDPIFSFLVPELVRISGKVDAFHLATNGLEALEYLKNNANVFPDLILVDLNMPVMDGFEFLERYRIEFLPEHPEANVLVLSSSISESDRERVQQYEFVNEFLNKPLTPEKITRLSSQYFSQEKVPRQE